MQSKQFSQDYGTVFTQTDSAWFSWVVIGSESCCVQYFCLQSCLQNVEGKHKKDQAAIFALKYDFPFLVKGWNSERVVTRAAAELPRAAAVVR